LLALVKIRKLLITKTRKHRLLPQGKALRNISTWSERV